MQKTKVQTLKMKRSIPNCTQVMTIMVSTHNVIYIYKMFSKMYKICLQMYGIYNIATFKIT